jgi:APA family basic amino acid/polyamine antiporter
VAVAPLVLLFAASATMLGLSRHVYVLARNRQVPSWLGKLGKRRATPHVAIVIAALIAIGLVVPGDVELLAGVFAFGAVVAISIAHVSLIRLRYTEPGLERPYKVPFNVPIRGGELPLPAVLGAFLAGAGVLSVTALHGGALFVGGGWMLFGLISYFVYRGVIEGIPLTAQVSVPEEALFKEQPDVEVASILVPVFGEGLDDEIVGTAGRLADSGPAPDGRRPRMELLYVMPLPLTIPLDAEPPAERREKAERALERATEVADEYASVEVTGGMIPARSVGEAIVAEARRRAVEAIVMGGEPPSQIRGGAILGGVRGSRTAEVGPVTEYVLRHAPCRVLVTAPPAWSFPGGEDPDWVDPVTGERPGSATFDADDGGSAQNSQ